MASNNSSDLIKFDDIEENCCFPMTIDLGYFKVDKMIYKKYSL